MLSKINNHFESNFKLWKYLSFLLLLLILFPRFNQQNLGPVKKLVGNKGHLGEYSYDVNSYISNVKYFRTHDSNDENLVPPFTYRVLPTYIASTLPFNEITSINIINLFFHFIALILIDLILLKLNFSPGSISLSRLLYIFSFPVFYFGTSGHVDPAIIMFLFSGIYFTLQKQFYFLVLITFFGALSKESMILILPFYLFQNRLDSKSLIKTIILSASFLVGTYLSRQIIPVDDSFLWKIEEETLQMNLARSRTYLSFILAYGHFFLLILLTMFFKKNIKDMKAFYISSFLGVCTFIYAIFAAYPDARFLWLAYPFSLPIIASLFHSNNEG